MNFNNFKASIWGTFQICSVIRTWRKLPPGHTHSPRSIGARTHECVMSSSWKTLRSWTWEGVLALSQLVSRGNICFVAASRTEVRIMVKPQISALLLSGKHPVGEPLLSLEPVAVGLSETLAFVVPRLQRAFTVIHICKGFNVLLCWL